MVPASRKQVLVGFAMAATVLLIVGVRMQSHRASFREIPQWKSNAAAENLHPVTELIVDISGEVRKPGVYSMVDGARVLDVLARAGGAKLSADTSSLNRAALVVDGQHIVVPRRSKNGAVSVDDSTDAVGPVSINSATVDQLDALPGFGPATAQKVVDDRAKNGPFKSIDDLDRVPGVGAGKIDAIRDAITL